MNQSEFYRKLDKIRDLPTLSEVAVELNSLLNCPETTIDQVSDTIKKDQAIVGKMLQLVNSSFFGLKEKVTTVPRAVVFLGFNTVKNVLISVSIIDSIKDFRGNGIDLKAFWQHAVSCAVVSKHLSSHSRIGQPEEAFTAGIVHDIGKLVLARFFPKEFLEILKRSANGHSFYQAESEVIPVRHDEIGAYLAERWQLPKIICDAIRYSHEIRPAGQHPVASLVMCADRIVGFGAFADVENWPVDKLTLNIQGELLQEVKNVKQWLPETVSEIEAACSVLLHGGKDDN